MSYKGAFFNRKHELFYSIYETYSSVLLSLLLLILSFIPPSSTPRVALFSFCLYHRACGSAAYRLTAELMIAIPPLLHLAPLFLCPCLSVLCFICLLSRFTYSACSMGSHFCDVFSAVFAVQYVRISQFFLRALLTIFAL